MLCKWHTFIKDNTKIVNKLTCESMAFLGRWIVGLEKYCDRPKMRNSVLEGLGARRKLEDIDLIKYAQHIAMGERPQPCSCGVISSPDSIAFRRYIFRCSGTVYTLGCAIWMTTQFKKIVSSSSRIACIYSLPIILPIEWHGNTTVRSTIDHSWYILQRFLVTDDTLVDLLTDWLIDPLIERMTCYFAAQYKYTYVYISSTTVQTFNSLLNGCRKSIVMLNWM